MRSRAEAAFHPVSGGSACALLTMSIFQPAFALKYPSLGVRIHQFPHRLGWNPASSSELAFRAFRGVPRRIPREGRKIVRGANVALNTPFNIPQNSPAVSQQPKSNLISPTVRPLKLSPCPRALQFSRKVTNKNRSTPQVPPFPLRRTSCPPFQLRRGR